MARISVEDCLEKIDNHFVVIILAAHRSRALLLGAKSTIEHSKNKAAVQSLREIAAGHVYYEGDLEDILRAHMSR